MKNMIFYFPYKIDLTYISGTMIRPFQMLRAFKRIGYNVVSIVGNSGERSKKISEVKKLIKEGMNIEFVYSESINFPIILSDPDHIPRHPFVDMAFFKFIKNRGIPIGLFYRDIFWRFSTYKETVPLINRLISVPLFYADLIWYKELLDVLFVPSKSFISYVPIIPKERLIPLPPGGNITNNYIREKKSKNFTVLYVGNVIPPEHDIGIIFRVAKILEDSPKIEFIISSPEKSWIKVRDYYKKNLGFDIPGNVKIEHKFPYELDSLYASSNIFIIPINDEYTKMTSLIKLYEAIGHAIPIVIACNGFSESGKFVKDENIGFLVSYSPEEVAELVIELSHEREKLVEKQKNIVRIQVEHTWESRAIYVEKILMRKKR